MIRKLFLLVCISFFSISSYSQELMIEELIVKGTKKLKTSFIKKISSMKSGVTLDSVKINEDIKRLKRLPSVSHVYFEVFNSEDDKYKIIYTIEENFTLIPEVNIWTTTNKKVAYKIGVNEYNLFGRNLGVGITYQNNGYDSYGVNFRAPYFFSNKLGFSMNYLDWKSEEPLYFSTGTANYLYNNKSFEVLGLYEMSFKNNFQLGVNFFNEKYSYLEGFKEEGIPLRLDVNKTLFKFIYEYDNLDYFYQYLGGFKSKFYGQYVVSSNNLQENFLIAWNDFFYFKRLGEKGNWANRMRVGLSTNNESPFAPFALDNNVNLRGVGILVDRGTGSIVWNSEYRHTLYEKKWFSMQGNVFVDAGSWRTPGGSLSDFIKSENIKIYSGIGLRFIQKKIYNATFRVDYGIGLTENSSKGIVFGIGQYF